MNPSRARLPGLAALALAFAAGAAAAGDWLPLPEDRMLVIDTSRGRMVVALQPGFAPQAVERVLQLSREGVYDGLLFHRVIPGFVAQTGNPNNRDGGVSSHPDLPPEFTFRTTGQGFAPARRAAEGSEGFLGVSPVVLDGRGRGWGAYCTGVAGMGRQEGVRTANSEIFFMLAPARRLDHDYTVWGQVVQGLDVLSAIAPGEPPAAPDRMVRVRLAQDLPPAERPRLEVMDPAGPAFGRRLAEARRKKGADLGLCDLSVPVRPAAGR
ncbi:MAG: hypothetical protein RL588_117 [Pseudomonadota bacterium]|jgi:peptidylprolyl isomerase